jgi:hypothetical protein
MIPLTIGVAILDEHTPVTSLETDAFLLHLAAFSAADVDLVHGKYGRDK